VAVSRDADQSDASKRRLPPCLTAFAPIFISFSFRLVNDQHLICAGVASVRRKFPRL
jgi:hypothetical protein